MIRLGRTWLCKGCTFALLGALVGTLAGMAFPPPESGGFLALGVLAAGGLGAMLARPLGKIATRLFPLGCLGFVEAQSLRMWDALGWAVAIIGAGSLALAITIYRRRGPWRGECATCPEREERPCSGFRRQLRRERAFQRLGGRMLRRERV